MILKFSSSAINLIYFFWIHWMENYYMTIFILMKSLRSICQILGCIEKLQLIRFIVLHYGWRLFNTKYGLIMVFEVFKFCFWSIYIFDLTLFWTCFANPRITQSKKKKLFFPVSTLFHLNFVFQFDVVISLFISLFTKNCFNRKPL